MAISLATLREIQQQENKFFFKDKKFIGRLAALIKSLSEDEILSEAQHFEIFDLVFDSNIKTNMRGNLLAGIVGGNEVDAEL